MALFVCVAAVAVALRTAHHVNGHITSRAAVARASVMTTQPQLTLPTVEDLALYDRIFAQHNGGGFIDGIAARHVFLGSGLPQPLLAAIWRLADMDGDAQLSHREFRVAMHLVTHSWRHDAEVPARLSADLLCSLDASRFEIAVELCERRIKGGEPLSLAALPVLLRDVFDEDFEAARARCERSLIANVTCLCPAAGCDGEQLFNDDLLAFQAEHTREGRQCRGGACISACSRVALAALATADECAELQHLAAALMARGHGRVPEGRSPDVARAEETAIDLEAFGHAAEPRALLLFVRLLERLRRAIALEYGLPLPSLRAHSGFVARITSRAAPGSYGTVHADESSCDKFHYSALLYLSSQGDEFSGGDFVFSDEPSRAVVAAPGYIDGLTIADDHTAERRLWRVAPQRGRALVFSSGFENIHYVDALRSGERFTIGTFWTTEPVDDAVGEQGMQDLAMTATLLVAQPQCASGPSSQAPQGGAGGET